MRYEDQTPETEGDCAISAPVCYHKQFRKTFASAFSDFADVCKRKLRRLHGQKSHRCKATVPLTTASGNSSEFAFPEESVGAISAQPFPNAYLSNIFQPHTCYFALLQTPLDLSSCRKYVRKAPLLLCAFLSSNMCLSICHRLCLSNSDPCLSHWKPSMSGTMTS